MQGGRRACQTIGATRVRSSESDNRGPQEISDQKAGKEVDDQGKVKIKRFGLTKDLDSQIPEVVKLSV